MLAAAAICKPALISASIDGVLQRSASVETFAGSNAATLKMTNIGMNGTSAGGHTLCFVMAAPCNTLETLCGDKAPSSTCRWGEPWGWGT